MGLFRTIGSLRKLEKGVAVPGALSVVPAGQPREN